MTTPEPPDLGRFEPTPYDLGITDNPEVAWADVQPEPEALPDHAPEFDSWEAEWKAIEAAWDAHNAEREITGPEPEPEAEP